MYRYNMDELQKHCAKEGENKAICCAIQKVPIHGDSK